MQGLLQEDHILVQEVSQRAFGFWSISSLSMAIQYLRFFFFKNQVCQMAHRIERDSIFFQPVRLLN